MFGIDDLLLIGGSILLSALMYVAIRITAWLIAKAMVELINFIKNAGMRIGILRKKKALDKFIRVAEVKGNKEVAEELRKIKDSAGGLLTGADANGEEDWNQLKVVGTKDKEHDEMADSFMFSDIGKVKVL